MSLFIISILTNRLSFSFVKILNIFRIPVGFNKIRLPNLDTLSEFKGYFGLEFNYINGFLQQRIISSFNLIEKSQTYLIILLSAFGIPEECHHYYEIVENNHPDLNSAWLTSFLTFKSSKLNLSKKNISGDKNVKETFLGSTIKFLTALKPNFIFQIYFSIHPKNKPKIAGQLLLFNPIKNKKSLNVVLKGCKGIFSKYDISINTFSRFNIKNLKLRRKFKLKKPFKWNLTTSWEINSLIRQPMKNEILLHEVNRNVLYRLPPENLDLNNDFPLGYEVVNGLKLPPIVSLSLEDFTSHFSCFGLSSFGKSRLIYHLLRIINSKNLNFLVFDTKGEYFEALREIKNDFSYFKIGSTKYPLKFNIFKIPENLRSDEHIQFLFSLFLGIMGEEDVSPQMTRLLFKSIQFTVKNYWSFKEFINILKHPNRLNLKGPYLELSGIALINRLTHLITGASGKCFVTKGTNIFFTKIIHENIIIDLGNFEKIENSIGRKIFVNTFFHFYTHALRSTQSNIRLIGNITNFVIFEEIQKIAPITFQGRNKVSSFVGMSPWTVRAYGISLGFIGTDPLVETPILTNTGITMAFYSKANHDKIAKLLGIPIQSLIEYLPELSLRKRFLLSFKGQIKLLETFEYILQNEKGKNESNALLYENNKNEINITKLDENGAFLGW